MDISLSFKSLDARRHGGSQQHVNINNNSTITNVSGDEGRLTVSFAFSSNYEPNIGSVRIEGDLVVEGDAELVEKAVQEWGDSNSRNLPKELAEQVHNTILTNCIIEASVLARDVKLPSPVPMPQVKLKDNETQSYIR
ncbi:MAG: hypothetical protein GF416_08660 [Candidatus Altiarchaeales archaeon]|nr:hypothetical protein [Candidatus Altiarchaeales archaeon]MBD3417187.1 hypothetical protein [Candidatus Altiarchaeales archaeon]